MIAANDNGNYEILKELKVASVDEKAIDELLSADDANLQGEVRESIVAHGQCWHLT